MVHVSKPSRELSATEIQQNGIELIRENLKVLLIPSFLMTFLTSLPSLYVSLIYPNFGKDFATSMNLMKEVAVLLEKMMPFYIAYSVVVIPVSLLLMVASITITVALLDGQQVDIGAHIRSSTRFLIPLLKLYGVIIVGFMLAFLALMVPAFFMPPLSLILILGILPFFFFMITVPYVAQTVVIIEKRRTIDALKYTRFLLEKRYWKAFSSILLAFILSALVGMAGGMITSSIPFVPGVVLVLLQSAVSAVGYPLTFIAPVLLYYSLLIHKNPPSISPVEASSSPPASPQVSADAPKSGDPAAPA